MTKTRLIAQSLALALSYSAVLVVPRAAVAQAGPLIVIDAGHGGDEIGVEHGEILEKDVILRLSFNMAAELLKQGAQVMMTRSGDYPVAWDDRRAMAEEAGADLLVMLHAMGAEDPAVHGAEIYFFEEDESSTMAAHLTAQALVSSGTAVTAIPRPWPFLQSPTVPTVMIELGHLSNPLELRSLQSDDYHRELAHAVLGVAAELTGDH